ncbi:MAG TPA: exopolysaccharide Pel transporter PelG [Polyangia bacterium]|nr:exopolysaccharide Pel transporter PelG [Polyangia bacterium]
MAGIGFELRKLLDRQSLWGLVKAYAYAGVISSGPWVLSIVGVMGIGLLSVGRVAAGEVRQFLVTITYLMAASLIATGGLQLMFARFIADCVYRREEQRVLPNLLGALTVTGLGASALAVPLMFVLAGPLTVRLLTVVALVVLSASWIAVVLLSSLRDYRAVVTSFLVGYLISVACALLLRPLGLVGLLAGFLVGQVVLLIAMVGLVAGRFPSGTLVAFEFLDRKRAYLSLAATGLLYNLGIWIDKLIFWFTPSTSEVVLGPLRASIIYDIPIFLAYLSIVPGMAVFLVRVETAFAEEYEGFFAAVRDGETLADIRRRHDRLTIAVGNGISDIFKVQGTTVLVLLLAGPRLLKAVGISGLYLQLFSVDVAGVAMQVLMLAVFNVLFYLDQRRATLALSATFCGLNAVLTVATQHAGPPFYGYGFAISTAITSLVGLLVASRKLDRLEADTFMRVG